MLKTNTLTNLAKYIFTANTSIGLCPVCDKRTLFIKEQAWLREHFRCIRCGSIPRNRALISVLKTCFSNYRLLKIHESSPSGPASQKLVTECPDYLPTHFYPEVAPGEFFEGVQCENLEAMTFADNSFDLVITQDVLEHVFNPDRVFTEIARTLKPGGAHIFTVPFHSWQNTRIRAKLTESGIQHFEAVEYHGNPIDPEGSLVTIDWGYDLMDHIYLHAKMTTTIFQIVDRHSGIIGDSTEVFVSRKT